MANGSTEIKNTIVVSDIHLADGEPPHPGNPLWKRFKRPKYFIDRSFKRFLEFIQSKCDGTTELVLNGDIFDFDSTLLLPERPKFKVSWLEKVRGLDSQEEKSRFKIKVILEHHPVWVEAIRNFVLEGHRLVFIIGNHDMELHWPSVQQDILDFMNLPANVRKNVRFCEWFYISNKDTLIEHGNQYDAYCLCSNPIRPFIKKHHGVAVRLPFGNLAGKLMLNGMGLMNPHVESSYIMTFRGYLVFFYRYVVRVQPVLIWTWFWSAMVTMVYSIREGLLPSLSDALSIEDHVQDIANRSNATPGMVRSLRELHVHPAIYNPFMILRELWLDRALLFLFIFVVSFELMLLVNTVVYVSLWWLFVPAFLLLPIVIFYAHSVESDVYKVQRLARKLVPLVGKIANVKRIVMGHTHREMHSFVEGMEVLNTGTWSPAFHDVECTQRYGTKCFAWIKTKGKGRIAELHEWKDPGTEVMGVS